MTGQVGERVPEAPLEAYRTAPLSYPLHVLDQYGESLCGTLRAKQARFLDRRGYTDLPTLAEKRDGQPWEVFHGSLCGNCRSVLLARCDDPAMHEGWALRQAVTDDG